MKTAEEKARQIIHWVIAAQSSDDSSNWDREPLLKIAAALEQHSPMAGRRGKRKEMETNKNVMIGKYVIVRANVAGVHAGIVESIDGTTVTLTKAYRLWRVYTRDKSGSISDIAANGLKPNGGHSIGAMLERVMIVNPNGLEIAQMKDEAYQTLSEWAGK